MKTLFTASAKTLEPTTYCVWAIDRATKSEVEFKVKAFTIKEALTIAKEAYTNENPDGCRIRVCVDEEKFDNAKKDWLRRLAEQKEKNHAEKINGLKEIFFDNTIDDKIKFDMICDYIGYTK